MYKNFKEYWEEKKDLFEKLGVDRTTAHMIWCDAANCLEVQLKDALTKS